MITLFFILYLLAGICFGLAAGSVVWRKVDFVAAGLGFWVLVEIIKALQRL